MACVTATLVVAPSSAVIAQNATAAIQVTGVVGIRGPSGGESTYEAGQTLSGHRAIKISDGKAFYCDAAEPADAGKAIGITIGAAMQGATATLRCIGRIVEPSWVWAEGPVYVGVNGALTQTAAGLAFIQQIGVAGATNSIDVNPQLAIIT